MCWFVASCNKYSSALLFLIKNIWTFACSQPWSLGIAIFGCDSNLPLISMKVALSSHNSNYFLNSPHANQLCKKFQHLQSKSYQKHHLTNCICYMQNYACKNNIQNGTQRQSIHFMIILHLRFSMPNAHSTHIWVDDWMKLQFSLSPSKVKSPPPLNR